MRSLKDYNKRNEKLYGKKFRFYRDNIPSLNIYTITTIPTENGEWSHFNDNTYCWVEWGEDGVFYDWGSCRRNIKAGIWKLL